MASATPEDVRRLAALARISIPEDTLATFAREFESVLSYVGKLDELSIDMAEKPPVPERHNVLRADENSTVPGTYTEVLTEAFPQRSGDSLVVKQIIAHD